jgi:hypothetical protein
MTLTTFLLVVLAAWVGTNLDIKLGYPGRPGIKFLFTLFGVGCIMMDRSDTNDLETQNVIAETVIDRKEWHIHLGRYYIFYLIK